MNIGVIGSGELGGTLARRLGRCGHDVSIANSRGPESLREFANENGVTPASLVAAVKAAEVVILSIPTKAIPDLPRDLFADAPEDVVIVDTCNYHPELRDGRIEEIDRGMLESAWVALQLGRPVIKAFNSIFATSLTQTGTRSNSDRRVALPVAGDQPEAKAVVLGLIDDLGFDAVDIGSLDESWRQQTGAPAYCRDLNATALRRALAEATPDRIAEYREREEMRIRDAVAARAPS